jgi:hypothetical protein
VDLKMKDGRFEVDNAALEVRVIADRKGTFQLQAQD